jgi:hypothetical protein
MVRVVGCRVYGLGLGVDSGGGVCCRGQECVISAPGPSTRNQPQPKPNPNPPLQGRARRPGRHGRRRHRLDGHVGADRRDLRRRGAAGAAADRRLVLTADDAYLFRRGVL